MELFDKKFVYIMWDDSLLGKEGFVASTIRLLIDFVENNVRTNHWQKLEESHSADLPFHSTTGMNYGFAYYDPNYECKRAYAQGKTIQSRPKLSGGSWVDCIGKPNWYDVCEYRIKSEEPEQVINKVWFNKRTKCMVYGPADEERDTGSYQELFEGTAAKCCEYILKRAHLDTIMSAYYCDNKQVQFRHSASPSGCTDWTTCTPTWLLDCEYRVKPEESKCNTCSYQCEPGMPCDTCRDGSNYKLRVVVKPMESKKKRHMTNRELAKWLAGGCGECLHNNIAFTGWNYLVENKDKTVKDSIKIRRWDEEEWSEPLIEE